MRAGTMQIGSRRLPLVAPPVADSSVGALDADAFWQAEKGVDKIQENEKHKDHRAICPGDGM